MKRILVLTGSMLQERFVKRAKEMGCYVGVIDMIRDAPAGKIADEFFLCSAIDVQGIMDICKQFKPDGITTGICDIPVLTAATVCSKLGLPGMSESTAIKATDKAAMINAFKKNGVAHPEYQVIHSVDEKVELEFPVITKPVDKSGSRGINLAKNETELRSAIRNSLDASDSKTILVEEYLEGPEVSVELLVQDGIPHVLQVTDKLTSGAPHFVEIGHSQPSALPEQDIDAIKELAVKAALSLGMINSPAHAEIKVTKSGPKMVEIGARMGADLITTDLLPRSTGIDLAGYEINRALGTPIPFVRPENEGSGVAVRFINATNGVLMGVENIEDARKVEGIELINITVPVGSVIKNTGCNSDRIGYVLARGRTAAEALQACEKAIARLDIRMA